MTQAKFLNAKAEFALPKPGRPDSPGDFFDENGALRYGKAIEAGHTARAKAFRDAARWLRSLFGSPPRPADPPRPAPPLAQRRWTRDRPKPAGTRRPHKTSAAPGAAGRRAGKP